MTFTIPLAASASPARRATALHLFIAVLLIGVGAACGAFYWTSTMSPDLPHPYYPARAVAGISTGAGALIFALAVWERRRAQRGKALRALPFLEIGLLIFIAVLLVNNGYYVPAALLGVAALGTSAMVASPRRSTALAEVMLDSTGIHRGGLVRRGHIRWREVSRVILRPGVLTVDCYDNRLYQWAVAEDAASLPDKETLEPQCAAWVAAAEGERNAADW